MCFLAIQCHAANRESVLHLLARKCSRDGHLAPPPRKPSGLIRRTSRSRSISDPQKPTLTSLGSMSNLFTTERHTDGDRKTSLEEGDIPLNLRPRGSTARLCFPQRTSSSTRLVDTPRSPPALKRLRYVCPWQRLLSLPLLLSSVLWFGVWFFLISISNLCDIQCHH